MSLLGWLSTACSWWVGPPAGGQPDTGVNEKWEKVFIPGTLLEYGWLEDAGSCTFRALSVEHSQLGGTHATVSASCAPSLPFCKQMANWVGSFRAIPLSSLPLSFHEMCTNYIHCKIL